MNKKKQKIGLLVILTLLCMVITFLFKTVPQSIAYHQFADNHEIWNIPNFANVISNIPFILVGIIGMIFLKQTKGHKNIVAIYFCLFIGILLTGFGSAYYHLSPNNNTLVWDRIPMTIVFMSLSAATIAEFINERAGFNFLLPLLTLGIGSVIYWHFTELQNKGDLRLYAFVQFYPILFIPLVIIIFPSTHQNRAVMQLVWVVIWYIAAKVLEHFDKQLYDLTCLISGHSLKHLAASVSTLYLVSMFRVKYVTRNSSSQ